jgi:hypothetical protein
VILNVEELFLRPHLHHLPVEDGLAVIGRQLFGEDDVGVVGEVLPLVAGVVVVEKEVAVICGLQDGEIGRDAVSDEQQIGPMQVVQQVVVVPPGCLPLLMDVAVPQELLPD